MLYVCVRFCQLFTKEDKYLAFVANYYMEDNFDLQYSYIKMGKHFSQRCLTAVTEPQEACLAIVVLGLGACTGGPRRSPDSGVGPLCGLNGRMDTSSQSCLHEGCVTLKRVLSGCLARQHWSSQQWHTSPGF